MGRKLNEWLHNQSRRVRDDALGEAHAALDSEDAEHIRAALVTAIDAVERLAGWTLANPYEQTAQEEARGKRLGRDVRIVRYLATRNYESGITRNALKERIVTDIQEGLDGLVDMGSLPIWAPERRPLRDLRDITEGT